MVKCILSYLVLCAFLQVKAHEYGAKQYHVQVDEGPVRSFRYETYNGQYRKEKRLSDGTVIGSYAWMDANGVLRKKTYIADSDGYRIVKSEHILLQKPALPNGDSSFEDNTISRSQTNNIIEVTTKRPNYRVRQRVTSAATPPVRPYTGTNEILERNDFIKPTTFRPFTNEVLERGGFHNDLYLCCELSVCNFQNLEASINRELLRKIYCHNYRDAFNYVPPDAAVQVPVNEPVVQNIYPSTNGIIVRSASTEQPIYEE